VSAAQGRALDAPVSRRAYFFLSYAHSAPLPGQPDRADVDPSIARFFSDLGRAVTLRSHRLPAGTEAGFYDQMLPPGADLKAELARVLGRSEVFLPLYSPKYFQTSWALRELEVFKARVKNAHQTGDGHILPVLWTPFLSWKRPAIVEQAIRQGPAIAEYQERGLRALQWLSAYRPSYVRVVEALAERIVDTAENHPLGPSEAPDIDAVSAGRVSGPTFTVAFLESQNAAGVRLDRRPAEQDWWRPVAGATVPKVAEHAGEIAERLGLATQIADFRTFQGAPANTPTIVLVDPWVVTESGSRFLAQAFDRLPDWVTVVVLRPEGEPEPAAAVEAVKVIDSTRSGPARIVRDMRELADILPALIAKVRRSYLRTGEVFPPESATNRRPPRLRDSRRWRSEEPEHD
jgi:FxsC-like protein